MDYTLKVLLENSKTFKEKNEVRGLEKTEKTKIDNIMISQLYKSAIDRSYVDFDDVELSKGDIEKYKGYDSMMECIDILQKVSSEQNVKIDELEILTKAISNVKAHKGIYTDGFALKKNFIIMQYNTIVLACIHTLNCIISSYINYTRRVDNIEFTIVSNKNKADKVLIRMLSKFNDTCNSGENRKLLTLIMKEKDSFVGADDLILGGMIVGTALSIVPIIRELIFYFYYTRMKTSEYLEHQSMLIELNKKSVENTVTNPKKRKEILKKQEQIVNKLNKLSDKIRVDHRLAETKSSSDVKSQEKEWTLGSLKAQASQIDSNFTLL